MRLDWFTHHFENGYSIAVIRHFPPNGENPDCVLSLEMSLALQESLNAAAKKDEAGPFPEEKQRILREFYELCSGRTTGNVVTFSWDDSRRKVRAVFHEDG